MIGTRIRIEVLDTETQVSQDYELDPGEGPIQIGRDRTSQVVLDSPSASRRHCEIVPQEDGWFIRNLSSLGTLQNGSPISKDEGQVLRSGDVIECANFQLRIRITQVTDPTLKPDPHAIKRLFSEMEAAPPAPPRLWLFADVSVVTHELPHEGSVLTIGRAADCDIRLADPHRVVSAIHARVERNYAGVFLYDASRNGIFVNGVQVEEQHALVDGDRITVAVAAEDLDRPLLVYSAEGNVEEPPGPGRAVATQRGARGGAPEPAPPLAPDSTSLAPFFPGEVSGAAAPPQHSASSPGAPPAPPVPPLGARVGPAHPPETPVRATAPSRPPPGSSTKGLVEQIRANLLIVLVLVVSALALITVLVWGLVLLRS